MTYRLTSTSAIRINTLNLVLGVGQVYECSKNSYDTNTELQALVKQGLLKLSIKSEGLVARAGIPKSVPRSSQPTQEVHHHHHQELDMEALASLLINRLSGILTNPISSNPISSSPISSNPISSNPATQSTTKMDSGLDEPLVFIPSRILSNTDKVSETPLASQSESLDSELADALSALKALKRANKP